MPDRFGQVQWHNLKSLSLRELQSWACLLQLILAARTMDDGWDNCLLERSSSSLSLASSQTSVVTPPLPKKSSSLTDTGKKTSLNACSCRVQTAVALPICKKPTALSLLVPRWKKRTPIGDGLPGLWLEIIYLIYGDGRQNFKKATRVQSLRTCQACLLIGTHPHNRR